MPDEDRLQPGPKRELTLAIHTLYQDAGMPGTRTISSAIRTRDDLPDTVSHEAVRGILLGARTRWSKVQSLVMQLTAWSVANPSPDPKLILSNIHQLWLATERSIKPSLEVLPGDPTNQVDQPNDVQAASIEASGNFSAAGSKNQADSPNEQDSRPFIRWESRMGPIEVFDKQMAIQIIKDMGQSDE